MKQLLYFTLLFLVPLTTAAQTMVLYTPKTVPLPPATFAASFTGNISYQGGSVIDTQGIGYYNESIPSSSIIEVEINASRESTGDFNLTASHSSGLSYSYTGKIFQGVRFYPMTPNSFTPNSFNEVGTLSMNLTHAGINGTVTLAPRIDVKSLPANQTQVTPILIAGKMWMDRPLGAHRRSTHIFNDPFSKSSLFQWGRKSDGHEIVVTHGDNPSRRKMFNVNYSNVQSDNPGHSMLIFNDAVSGLLFPNRDWRVNIDDSLWSGATAPNNPCPSGYRLPTYNEINDFADAAFLNGYDSHTISPPFISAQGDFFLNLMQLDVTIKRIIKENILATSTNMYASNVGLPSHAQNRAFGVVIHQSSHTAGFAAKIYPNSVRCIQN